MCKSRVECTDYARVSTDRTVIYMCMDGWATRDRLVMISGSVGSAKRSFESFFSLLLAM